MSLKHRIFYDLTFEFIHKSFAFFQVNFKLSFCTLGYFFQSAKFIHASCGLAFFNWFKLNSLKVPTFSYHIQCNCDVNSEAFILDLINSSVRPIFL